MLMANTVVSTAVIRTIAPTPMLLRTDMRVRGDVVVESAAACRVAIVPPLPLITPPLSDLYQTL